jgi:hypothetical protein
MTAAVNAASLNIDQGEVMITAKKEKFQIKS